MLQKRRRLYLLKGWLNSFCLRKNPPLVKIGDAVSKVTDAFGVILAARTSKEHKSIALIGETAIKAAYDLECFNICQRLIEEMTSTEQKLQSQIYEMKRASELFKKRAARRKKAKDHKAAQDTALVAEKVSRELTEFLKVKDARLAVLRRLSDQFDRGCALHGQKHLELLASQSAASVANARHLIDGSKKSTSAVEKAKRRLAEHEAQGSRLSRYLLNLSY